tara:strand:- start:178 stop:690 length:513 start_codon:yes stop_codon:yes gene_type:complete
MNGDNDFKFSFKYFGKKIIGYIIIFILCFGIKYGYENYIPLDKNHGIEYNSEREKLGIAEIGENWEKRKYQSEQFTTYWWKPKPRKGHFKKVIEYGIFCAKSETDYYQNEKIIGTFAWSKYNFDKKTFEYFLEKPNENEISITEKGKVKYEKPTIIMKINKTKFEKYKAE